MTCPMGTSDTAPKSLNLDNYTKKLQHNMKLWKQFYIVVKTLVQPRLPRKVGGIRCPISTK